MTVGVKAYLAIENSLSTRLVNGWAEYARPLLTKIWEAMRDGDKEKAVELSNHVDLEPLIESNKGFIDYMSNAALLFGSTRVIDDPRLTQVARGKYANVSRNAALLLQRAVVGNIEDAVRKALLVKIAEWSAAHLDTAIQKDGTSDGAYKAWQKRHAAGEGQHSTREGELTGSLGIARHDMPQIRSTDMPEFIAFAEAKGVTFQSGYEKAAALRPAQREYNPKQVAQLEANALIKPVTISADNYVLDGTNRWLRIRSDNPEAHIAINRIGLPARDALALMHSFPKSFRKHVSQVGATVTKYDPDQPRDARGRWTDEASAKEAVRGTVVAYPNGEPMKMFHGSVAEFDSFDIGKAVSSDPDAYVNGIWFTSDEGEASPAWRNPVHTYEAYVDLRNPAPWPVIREQAKNFRGTGDDFRKALTAQGYDGFVFDDRPAVNREEFERTGETTVRTARGGKITLRRDKEFGGVEMYRSGELITGYTDLDDFEKSFSKTVVVFDPKQVHIVNRRPSRWGGRSENSWKMEDARTLLKIYKFDPSGIKKAELGDYVEPFVSFEDDIFSAGENLLQLTSALHTSRLSAFGFTVEADVRGLTKYQISAQLDKRVCPVCEVLNGRVFNLDSAQKLLRDALGAENPDDLKMIQPWPPQDKDAVAEIAGMSEEELVAHGWNVPPFHPWCRCLLVPVGSPEDMAAETPSAVAARQPDEPLDQELASDHGSFLNQILAGMLGNKYVQMEGPLSAVTLSEINAAQDEMSGLSGVDAAEAWSNLLAEGYTTEELEAIFEVSEDDVLSGDASFP